MSRGLKRMRGERWRTRDAVSLVLIALSASTLRGVVVCDGVGVCRYVFWLCVCVCVCVHLHCAHSSSLTRSPVQTAREAHLAAWRVPGEVLWLGQGEKGDWWGLGRGCGGGSGSAWSFPLSRKRTRGEEGEEEGRVGEVEGKTRNPWALINWYIQISQNIVFRFHVA